MTEAPTDKSTVFQASAFDDWHQDDRHHLVHHDNSGVILLTLTTTQAGLRTLHEAGPELQRTISTDLEVTSRRFFCSLDNISKMMFNKCSKVMMAAEAMAGADAEEDIHTRF